MTTNAPFHFRIRQAATDDPPSFQATVSAWNLAQLSAQLRRSWLIRPQLKPVWVAMLLGRCPQANRSIIRRDRLGNWDRQA